MLTYNETPASPPYVIKNPEMVKLVKSIFIVIDQAWVDVVAFDVHLLIEDYIKKHVK